MASPRAGAYLGAMTTRALREDDTDGLACRLLALGGPACRNDELLGLLLDGGRGGSSGSERARTLLAAAGELARLADLPPEAFRPAVPRGTARLAAVVRAALELGRRAAGEPLGPLRPVRDAADVHAHFRGRLPQLDHEVFYALLLDGRNRVRTEVPISVGTLTAALVHPRDVFGPALRAGAAAVVLVHNHPSGDPTPSGEDLALTERLEQVGELVGIRVLDHVVVAQGGYVSLAERGRDR
jgi:DNA repair protein RadC